MKNGLFSISPQGQVRVNRGPSEGTFNPFLSSDVRSIQRCFTGSSWHYLLHLLVLYSVSLNYMSGNTFCRKNNKEKHELDIYLIHALLWQNINQRKHSLTKHGEQLIGVLVPIRWQMVLPQQHFHFMVYFLSVHKVKFVSIVVLRKEPSHIFLCSKFQWVRWQFLSASRQYHTDLQPLHVNNFFPLIAFLEQLAQVRSACFLSKPSLASCDKI